MCVWTLINISNGVDHCRKNTRPHGNNMGIANIKNRVPTINPANTKSPKQMYSLEGAFLRSTVQQGVITKDR